ARRRMSHPARANFGYDGAGQHGIQNRAAVKRWEIVPRMASRVPQLDLTSNVARTRLNSPIMLAPVGAADLIRRNADVQIATGAAPSGAPYILSNQVGSPMEATAAAMGSAPHCLQR